MSHMAVRVVSLRGAGRGVEGRGLQDMGLIMSAFRAFLHKSLIAGATGDWGWWTARGGGGGDIHWLLVACLP